MLTITEENGQREWIIWRYQLSLALYRRVYSVYIRL